ISARQYVYDAFPASPGSAVAGGRRTEMKTYRGGSPWDGSTWPGSPGTADVTTWVYENATGLLEEQEYADGKKTTYTYTDEGRLETRTWARSVTGSHVTTYVYDADTGDMTDVQYSDSTPDVEFTYDRTGRQKTVTDVVGTRTFAYNADMSLDTETIDGSSG